ncbi:DNA adenine methylase [Burkholderia ambifaria]|uniref:DNA adenine methylase n=1 Tax=Burkholderia ambifaria TaxID=152480 RepID=UPI001BA0070A|nr:DNA adenine methylase [Burkholderia ambifaria]MBR8179304.1 DNA adenine methylase [Burkholderia ambifaria]
MKPTFISELRKSLGESQAQFGERFGVSQVTVAHWENGRSLPTRSRLAELSSLASSATPATPAEPPFRPIQYLGSKQRLVETIDSVIDEVAPGSVRVGDLFAGSGVVSASLGRKRPVTAVDMQVYSEVLSTGLLQGRAEHFSALTDPKFVARIEEIASRISRLLAPLIAFEEEAMAAACAGKPELLIELIESGSIAVHAQRASTNASPRLARLMRNAAEKLKMSEFTAGDVTATHYFGGPYFSYHQAITLDATFIAARLQSGAPSLLREALAVLLSTASEIVNTVGKQFAQPMKLKKADGRVPPLLLQRTLRDRSLNVLAVYKDWAARWIRSAALGSFKHRVVRGDVLDFIESDRSCGVWYADPPYTIDHYSRFYHVLETLSLRDSPRLDEMNKRGESTVMRGVYRVGRYQSPFCIPSQAPVAFDRLFSATATSGAPLVLSYSPFDEKEGHRPRLLTLKEMTETAKRHYQRVAVMEINEHSHRKLNAKSMNTSIRSDAERLIICEASS